jgi:hypothetical protein
MAHSSSRGRTVAQKRAAQPLRPFSGRHLSPRYSGRDESEALISINLPSAP